MFYSLIVETILLETLLHVVEIPESGPLDRVTMAMKLLTNLKTNTKIALTGVILIVSGFFVGFYQFTQFIPPQQPVNIAKADAIVVLTGGKSRLTGAVKLLSAGKGGRLLISGVHQTTSSKALARLVPAQSSLFKCCVDLDKAARNTVGNAAETARWVAKNKFKSLIVVTSNYHMPRSLAELQNVLPQINLIAYPVVVDSIPVSQWWTDRNTAHLVMSEYVKYLAARIRLGSGLIN